MNITIVIITLFNSLTIYNSSENQIVGFWMSETKDLSVEIYKKNNRFYGKVVWFACLPETPFMEDFKDINNPNPSLRNRKWLGLEVVDNLKYANGEWNGGTIYDPNSGRKYSSVVRMKSENSIVVRGYWGLEIFGKSMQFSKVK